jgi:hypothetical protein
MNRPKHSINYHGLHRGSFRKKLGFTLGIILLLLGVAMGYWYKELVEIPVPSGAQEPANPTRSLTLDPPPPIHSLSSKNPEMEEQSLEDPGPRTYDPKNVERPYLSLQENTQVNSSISGHQPVSDTHPLPEHPQESRPQDNPDITNQPSSQKNLLPVIQPSPAPKPSLIISETDHDTRPGITKDVGPGLDPERPIVPATDITKGIQTSKPASPKEESMETFENKELKNSLDSIDAIEPAALP